MTIYTLYKKTHRVTGLKYLGYTKRKDVAEYPGSGLYWSKHISVHGYDVDTEILFQTESKSEMKAKGLYYSKLWNIVDERDQQGRKTWANIKDEDGYGGAMNGDLNGMFGKHWWNNGIDMVAAKECPGPEWTKGAMPGRSSTGYRRWNNGVEQKSSKECPGPGWVLGGLRGAKWWNDGINEKKSIESPGDNWTRGRSLNKTIRGYRVWNNGTDETRSKECPGPDWILGPLKGKNTGLKFYNNGEECRMFSEPPPGWVKGMLR